MLIYLHIISMTFLLSFFFFDFLDIISLFYFKIQRYSFHVKLSWKHNNLAVCEAMIARLIKWSFTTSCQYNIHITSGSLSLTSKLKNSQSYREFFINYWKLKPAHKQTNIKKRLFYSIYLNSYIFFNVTNLIRLFTW